MSAVLELARLQVLESIRRQVHLITLFLAFVLLIMPAYVNAFSMGLEGFERVSKDFGLTLIGYYGIAMALLLASSVVPRDIERKTIYPLLSRPVPRLAYLSGQFLGVAVLLAVSQLALGLVLMLAISALSRHLDSSVFLGVYGSILESSVLASACLCFSTRVSPPLAGVMGTFLFAVGGLSDTFIRFFIKEDRESQVTAGAARLMKALFPNFEVFRLKTPAVHHLPVAGGYEPAIALYAFGWILLFLLLANRAFEGRDL